MRDVIAMLMAVPPFVSPPFGSTLDLGTLMHFLSRNRSSFANWLLPIHLVAVLGLAWSSPSPVFSQEEIDYEKIEEEAKAVAEKAVAESTSNQNSLVLGVFLGGGVFCLGSFITLIGVGIAGAFFYFAKGRTASSGSGNGG